MLIRMGLGCSKSLSDLRGELPKAIASIKRVYDNEYLIFFDNFAKLSDLSEITKPSAVALRRMIHTVSDIYDSLL